MISAWKQTGRLIRTVRHLRYSQVLWRTRYLFERRLNFHTVSPIEDSSLPGVTTRLETLRQIPIFHRHGPIGEEAVDLLEQGRFRHLNLTRELGINPTDWLIGQTSDHRLWTVTLHYHEWVYTLAEAAVGGDLRALPLLERLLNDWLNQCKLDRPGARPLVWNSFAIATRLGWWVRAFALLGMDRFSPQLAKRLIRSCTEQASYLHSHLEWDLRGNHILRDAVGLAWAARFLSGPQSTEWMNTATQIALTQAREQVLPDGGHFERSPMYHLHVMEDFYILSELLEPPLACARMRSTCRRMAEYVRWMRHPDGEIPQFNDAAQHAVASPEWMLQLCRDYQQLDIQTGRPNGLKHFSDSGIVVWHDPTWSLFFDVGVVGPDYQPGHAHADTLSLELSYKGERLFVDPGAYSYDRNAIRDYDRSTAAHNTICIDGENSTEVWDIFRVGRRALPELIEANSTETGFESAAGHDGFQHLPGKPTHHRRIRSTEKGLAILDHIGGTGDHSAAGGYLLAPGWNVTPISRGWVVSCNDKQIRIALDSALPLKLKMELVPWHPEYGCEILTTRLVWETNFDQPFSVETRIIPER